MNDTAASAVEAKNERYIPVDGRLKEIITPFVNSGVIHLYKKNGQDYLDRGEINGLLSRGAPSKDIKKYSPMDLNVYDKERHIPIKDAFGLLEKQGDPYLSPEKLRQVIDKGDIRVYDFKQTQYLDRLDIGRVYHKTSKRNGGLTIERYFSTEGKDPFESVGEYETRHLKILEKSEDGKEKIKFEMIDAVFPKSWSDNSARIVADKYFFKPKDDVWKKKLEDSIGKPYEFSPTHLINRVTNFIVDEGDKLGYFASDKDREIFRDELKWLQINQRFAFNSPVQFNAGLFNEYGIEGSKGIVNWRNPITGEVESVERGRGYWKNPRTKKVEEFDEGEYIHPQCHACFIKGPRDDLESIVQHVKDEAAIFASGSGIGQDIGVLREEGAPLSQGGKASGPLSFLKIYDDAAGTIKSGGKSRRAARMTTMRYYHPDIMKFIRSKVGEDRKALILMENDIEAGMDGEAVRTVTSQNTNLSIRVDDYFFEQLEKGGKIELKRVTNGEVVGEVPAERMLREIAFGSWRIGDPALQYESKIQDMHTAKNSGRINSSNPCSEYMFLDDTSCNLHSHNLLADSDEKGNFNVEEFKKAVWLSSIASDILNDAAGYPVKDIAMISPEFRTIGTGYANLGALLMRRGLAYDSNEGRALAGAITALMTGTSYEASSDLAEKLGPFIHFEFNKGPMLEVMKKHKKNLENVLWEHVPGDLKKAAYDSWENVVDRGEKVGFRNAQASVLAPTGTISYFMDCDTTGVEPAYSLISDKYLAGGGTIPITTKEVPNALRNLGYSPEEIKDISKFIDNNNTVIGAPHLNPDSYNVFATAVGNEKGKGAISFEGHVRMLGAAQPFISGAISKTNNMPESATVKDIYDSYMLANNLGLKAFAVFRHNSKPTSAMSVGERSLKVLKRGEKEDLPFSGSSFRQAPNIDGVPFLINIGEYEDGRPGEIVIESYTSDSTLGAILKVAGIDASTALKRGVDLEDVVKKWVHGFEPRGLVTVETSNKKIIPHPYIKQVSSPLDFIRRLTLLHYKGDTSMAQEPDKIDVRKLRGFTHGAFRTYARMKVDDWDVNDVLNDPELGGFVEDKGGMLKLLNEDKPKKGNGNPSGRVCVCGNAMRQITPGCWECKNCGDKFGGCG